MRSAPRRSRTPARRKRRRRQCLVDQSMNEKKINGVHFPPACGRAGGGGIGVGAGCGFGVEPAFGCPGDGYRVGPGCNADALLMESISPFHLSEVFVRRQFSETTLHLARNLNLTDHILLGWAKAGPFPSRQQAQVFAVEKRAEVERKGFGRDERANSLRSRGRTPCRGSLMRQQGCRFMHGACRFAVGERNLRARR
jgi:hypothetical protein